MAIKSGKWKVDGEAGWCSVEHIARELSVQEDQVYDAVLNPVPGSGVQLEGPQQAQVFAPGSDKNPYRYELFINAQGNAYARMSCKTSQDLRCTAQPGSEARFRGELLDKFGVFDSQAPEAHKAWDTIEWAATDRDHQWGMEVEQVVSQ
jgi:hypothetical protein